MSSFLLFVAPIVATRKEQVTVSLNKNSIQNVIKKLQEVSFANYHTASSQNGLMETNDHNNKQPDVIPVGSGDDEITHFVSGARSCTRQLRTVLTFLISSSRSVRRSDKRRRPKMPRVLYPCWHERMGLSGIRRLVVRLVAVKKLDWMMQVISRRRPLVIRERRRRTLFCYTMNRSKGMNTNHLTTSYPFIRLRLCSHFMYYICRS